MECLEGRGRSFGVHQLTQTNWKPSGGSKEPASIGELPWWGVSVFSAVLSAELTQ